jgi:hypothetical protein
MDFIEELIDMTTDIIARIENKEEKTINLDMAREAAEVLLEELRAVL